MENSGLVIVRRTLALGSGIAAVAALLLDPSALIMNRAVASTIPITAIDPARPIFTLSTAATPAPLVRFAAR